MNHGVSAAACIMAMLLLQAGTATPTAPYTTFGDVPPGRVRVGLGSGVVTVNTPEEAIDPQAAAGSIYWPDCAARCSADPGISASDTTALHASLLWVTKEWMNQNGKNQASGSCQALRSGGSDLAWITNYDTDYCEQNTPWVDGNDLASTRTRVFQGNSVDVCECHFVRSQEWNVDGNTQKCVVTVALGSLFGFALSPASQPGEVACTRDLMAPRMVVMPRDFGDVDWDQYCGGSEAGRPHISKLPFRWVFPRASSSDEWPLDETAIPTPANVPLVTQLYSGTFTAINVYVDTGLASVYAPNEGDYVPRWEPSVGCLCAQATLDGDNPTPVAGYYGQGCQGLCELDVSRARDVLGQTACATGLDADDVSVRCHLSTLSTLDMFDDNLYDTSEPWLALATLPVPHPDGVSVLQFAGNPQTVPFGLTTLPGTQERAFVMDKCACAAETSEQQVDAWMALAPTPRTWTGAHVAPEAQTGVRAYRYHPTPESWTREPFPWSNPLSWTINEVPPLERGAACPAVCILTSSAAFGDSFPARTQTELRIGPREDVVSAWQGTTNPSSPQSLQWGDVEHKCVCADGFADDPRIPNAASGAFARERMGSWIYAGFPQLGGPATTAQDRMREPRVPGTASGVLVAPLRMCAFSLRAEPSTVPGAPSVGNCGWESVAASDGSCGRDYFGQERPGRCCSGNGVCTILGEGTANARYGCQCNAGYLFDAASGRCDDTCATACSSAPGASSQGCVQCPASQVGGSTLVTPPGATEQVQCMATTGSTSSNFLGCGCDLAPGSELAAFVGASCSFARTITLDCGKDALRSLPGQGNVTCFADTSFATWNAISQVEGHVPYTCYVDADDWTLPPFTVPRVVRSGFVVSGVYLHTAPMPPAILPVPLPELAQCKAVWDAAPPLVLERFCPKPLQMQRSETTADQGCLSVDLTNPLFGLTARIYDRGRNSTIVCYADPPHDPLIVRTNIEYKCRNANDFVQDLSPDILLLDCSLFSSTGAIPLPAAQDTLVAQAIIDCCTALGRPEARQSETLQCTQAS